MDELMDCYKDKKHFAKWWLWTSVAPDGSITNETKDDWEVEERENLYPYITESVVLGWPLV
jgi:hypothetical protein